MSHPSQLPGSTYCFPINMHEGFLHNKMNDCIYNIDGQVDGGIHSGVPMAHLVEVPFQQDLTLIGSGMMHLI